MMVVVFFGVVGYFSFVAGSVAHAATIHNADYPQVQRQLDALRGTYGADIDVVVLGQGDACVDKDDATMQKCILREYGETAHLVVALNTRTRTIVSYYQGDDDLQLFDKQRTIVYEKAAIPSLRTNDYEAGLGRYLDAVQISLRTQCNTYTKTSSCTLASLDTAIRQADRDATADSLRVQRSLLWGVIGAMIALVGLIWLIRWDARRREIAGYMTDLHTMDETLRFMTMQVEADDGLYSDTQASLLEELTLYRARLEDLRTSSRMSIYTRMRSGERGRLLDDLMALTTKYADANKQKTHEREVLAKLAALKRIDL